MHSIVILFMKFNKLTIIFYLFGWLISPSAAQEIIRPVAPYITLVTIDTATNNTHIFWVESPTSNVAKYYIYYETATGGVVLDSMDAPANHYIHTGSGIGPDKLLYSVAAVDSAWNISTREDHPKHSSVFISSQYDSCFNRIIVRWDKYTGWGDSIAGYRLFRSRNFADFELLAGLSSDTLYVDNGIAEQGITENMRYDYYVVTLKNDGLESFSNIAEKYTYMPGPPESIVLDYVTVEDNNLLKLSFSFVDTSSISNFVLLRSNQIDADFLKIKTIPNTGAGSLIVYDSIFTGRDKFYYKIGALNTCHHVIKESNPAVNILLQGSSDKSIVNLQWNKYEVFLQGVQEYIIYRKTPEGDYFPHRITSSFITEFDDDISDLAGQEIAGSMTYRIGVVENGTGITAYSNEITVSVESLIFMPDAFTPDGDGINDIFKPVMSFFPEEYTMIIYDRNGIRIFQTNDPEVGWDGTINGSKAAEGVYLYYVEYKSFNGVRKSLKPGILTLFYPR